MVSCIAYRRVCILPVELPPFHSLLSLVLPGLPVGETQARSDTSILEIVGQYVAGVFLKCRVGIVEVINQVGVIDGTSFIESLDRIIVRVSCIEFSIIVSRSIPTDIRIGEIVFQGLDTAE